MRPDTSFGIAVVSALIDEPDAPKLMVEPIAKRWTLRSHGVMPGVRSLKA